MRFQKVLVGILFCLSISVQASENKKKSLPQNNEVARKSALKQIDDFAQRMAKTDPKYVQIEAKILKAIPLIGNNYTPDQWFERIQFLYAVLSEIDAKAVSIDPEEILTKYYPEEAQRAPLQPLSFSSDIRVKWVDERADELQQQLDSNTIDELEHAARMLAVANIYFPNDARFVSHRKYKLNLAIRLAKGEINKERLDVLWAMKRQEYIGEVGKEKAQRQQQQQMANDQAEAQQNAIDAQRRRV